MPDDDSEIGGDGGVAVADDASDALAGGVVKSGDEIDDMVAAGDRSYRSYSSGVWGVNDGLRYSELGFLLRRPLDVPASAFRSFSWTISPSIFTSDNSSRSRWFSIRSCSRSWSPFLISSSNSTPRSIAALYLYSRSSSDDVVFRACRSKSSLATSISRNFNCRVRCASRRVVISFCKAFWAEFPSVLDCLHLVYWASATVSHGQQGPEDELTHLPFIHLVP